ncbi:MAG: VWA domain-containing protein [Bacteroidaceae bacterium]|nr:VWA domain-containing protein [Bacteroidaceae bacterium]
MKTIHNLIVLDESGSMEVIKKEAFSGLNETLQSIRLAADRMPNMRQRVTVLLFDSDRMDFVYENTDISRVKPLDEDVYHPMAMTPLYDAIGRGVSAVRSHVENDDSVLVTIITDGYENASREYSGTSIAHLIDLLKSQSWTFTFIGTDNIDVETVAKSLHVDEAMAFRQDSRETRKMWRRFNRSRDAYYSCCDVGEAMPVGSFFKAPEEDDEED